MIKSISWKYFCVSCIVSFIWTSELLSQSTFNRRLAFGHNSFIARAVTYDNGRFYVSGTAFGDDPYLYNGTQLLLLDEVGVIIDSFLIAPEDSRIEAWGRENAVVNGELYFVGDTYPNGKNIFISKVDTEFNEYTSATFIGALNLIDESRFSNAFGIIADEERLYVYGSDVNPETVVNGQSGLVLAYDFNFNPSDTLVFSSLPERAKTMPAFVKTNAGFFGVLSSFSRERCEPQYQYSLLKFNSELSVVDSFHSQAGEQWFVFSDAYADPNGSIYIQTDSVHYDNFPIGPNDCISTVLFDAKISKFNADLELIWTKDLRPSGAKSFGNIYNAGIVPTSEPDKLVSAASFWNGTTVLANLVKFDTLGNEIWNRTYGYYDTTSNDVQVYDIKATPDGGFVLVGEVRVSRNMENDSLGRLPSQQGWIMKVDEDGCLIPGCGEVIITSSKAVLTLAEPDILLYPNPVEQDLYFYLGEVGGARTVSGGVYDAMGRMVKALRSRPLVVNMTYTLPLVDLPSGTYFLRLLLDNGQQVTKSFVKQ